MGEKKDTPILDEVKKALDGKDPAELLENLEKKDTPILDEVKKALDGKDKTELLEGVKDFAENLEKKDTKEALVEIEDLEKKYQDLVAEDKANPIMEQVQET